MNRKQMLNAMQTAYVTQKRGDESIYVINTKSPVSELVKRVQFALNEDTHSFELDYEIMNDATMILGDIEPDDLEDADMYELAADTASVYTSTRLSYLNIWNQDECSELARDSGADIATGAAIWYEQQVTRACDMLRDAIINNEE